ncbi:putative UDP-glucuronate:xylan alpha-glucuronosyltransferase 3 isoform X2 [Phragmites australis]|uniref:putative UDP-glucuronate:xylan alpha-glucuronosyltransferase 3 isoform X2 n=1 Tax=Phragmites australis TaxID=29695 RepID=UPI002D78F94B|nr:putative UDP-glucuronate:xylan alpha-glucuronosyltransferase 3 isoform X2 [Phragmites australis]
MGPLEPRYRPAGVPEDTTKRRTSKSKSFKDVENFEVLVLEKNCGCKFKSLRIFIIAIISATVITLLTPTLYEHQLQSASRYVDVGWMWDKTSSDPRYVSSVNVQWEDVYRAVGNLNSGNRNLKVGILNFNSTEYGSWTQLLPDSHVSIIRLEHAKDSITWQTLYPEWIDEEEETEIPSCPSFPEPNARGGVHFDVIAVKLPCTQVGGWSRDVARLHLQLSAAKLAVSFSKRNHKVHVLLITDCFPIPNLFPCKNLVRHEGNAWLYSPDVKALREKLRLPVGSCELAVPLKAKSRLFSVDRRREAYATILHSASEYVCGAISAAQSIRQAGSTRDLVILVDETISDHHRKGLEAAGWKVRIIQRIRNPKAERDAYNEWNYSKFRLWQLTDYDKIIFIDADLLILRNVDFLFAMPEITATGNNATLFNSGVMVIEPSNCTFQLLMEHINEITSYNGGDQGYLNEIFTWWHRVPKHMNFLKHFWEGDDEAMKAKKTQLFGADPPILYVLHYLGLKPWLCFRDYDCNWNNRVMRGFASDVAHARWWKVHDKMPRKLQSYCLLRSRQKAGLEWDRRQAEKANFEDGHWRRNITDTRLKTCFEKFCFWESMLKHWGENNRMKSSPATKTTATAAASLASS